MKSKEEIEQLAESQYGTEIGSIRGSNPYDLEKDRKNGFIKGYTQCQEDMADEIEELKTNNSKIIWENACKAQMELVYEHCTHSPQGTNGHAIKHWVKQAEFKQD